MRKGNPAVYECHGKKSNANTHHWRRNEDGTATCLNGCGLTLNKEDADDCFYEHP